MPKYLIQASYTEEGVKGLLREGGSGRRAAVEQLIRGLGGRLEAFCYAFGDSDVYLATSLVFESGFELQLVGENSVRVACGPTIAQPDDLQPRKPGRKPRRGKGLDRRLPPLR